MSFRDTLTAQCDTEGCQASCSFDIDIVPAAVKILEASGWLVGNVTAHNIAFDRDLITMTCPWCVPKPQQGT